MTALLLLLLLFVGLPTADTHATPVGEDSRLLTLTLAFALAFAPLSLLSFPSLLSAPAPAFTAAATTAAAVGFCFTSAAPPFGDVFAAVTPLPATAAAAVGAVAFVVVVADFGEAFGDDDVADLGDTVAVVVAIAETAAGFGVSSFPSSSSSSSYSSS